MRSFPTQIDIFRDIQMPCYDKLMHEQINIVKTEKWACNSDSLLITGETGIVK